MKHDEKLQEATVPMIDRYKSFQDTGADPDDLMCDQVYVDRVTGAEVLRYDAADPANRPPLGPSDEDVFLTKGLDINEEVPVSTCTVSVSPSEIAAWAYRKAAKVEAQEEFERASELLADTDFFSYLGFNGTEFNFSDYAGEERRRIKPALEAKGFKMISFSMGEQDSFGPLSRVVRAVREDKGYRFVYG